MMAIATRSTAIAAFASRADAERALVNLLAAGFGPDRLGLVLPGDAADGATTDAGPVAVCVGGMFRALIGKELPEAEVRYYEEDLRQGRPLVLVRAVDHYQRAVDILNGNGGTYLPAF
jgi:hypothetical protein